MKKLGLISIFARHKVAANLLMTLMIMTGLWGLTQLNTQFLPNYNLKLVSVNVVWPGSSAEDVERSITTPLEKELRNVDHIKNSVLLEKS